MTDISYKQELLRKTVHLSSLWIPALILFAPRAVCVGLFAFLLSGNIVVEYGYYKRLPFFVNTYGRLFSKMLRDKETKGGFRFSGSPYVLGAAQIHYPLFPLRLMIKDSFKSKKRIASLTAPVLFLHGEKDSTVPVEQGREMFDAAPVSDKTLKLYPDGHHVDLYDFGASDDVVSWLDKRFK